MKGADDDMDKIAGNGEAIRTITRKRWKMEITATWDQNSADEMDKLADLSASPLEADWTFSMINGTVWGGKGTPVGDTPGNGNTALIPLIISGGGKLKKIVG